MSARFPLSHGQRALWFLHRTAPAAPAYIIGGSGRLQEDLDRTAFRRAFELVVERHGALRTVFAIEGGEPVQEVIPEPGEFYREVDVSGVASEALPERISEIAFQPFDLERGPLFRVFLLVGDGAPILVLNLHHIVGDLWSIAVLMRETGELYRALAEGRSTDGVLAPPPAPYAQQVAREAERLRGPEGEELLRFWRERFVEAPPVPLELPTDRPRPPVQTFEGGTVSAPLGQGLRRSLGRLARERGTNLFAAAMAGWAALLHRLSGQTGFAIGSPTSGRLGPGRAPGELAAAVGYHVNPVPIRARLDGDPSFAELVDRMARETEGALAHQGLPLPRLIEELEEAGLVGHDPSRSALFQVLLVLQKSPLPGTRGMGAFALGREGAPLTLGGIELTSIDFPQRGAQFDLALYLLEEGKDLVGSLEYNDALFERTTAERILALLGTLLEAALAAPGRPVSELPLLPIAERAELVERLARGGDLPEETLATAPVRISAQARATPGATALVVGEERLTYAELDRAVDALAGRLKGLGVHTEVPVGLFLGRSAELVVGLLAVHRAGGAYVPMDPAYPAERTALVMAASGMPVVLTDDASSEALPECSGTTVVRLDGAARVGDGARRGDWPEPPLESLSHVIYTSGSTGAPKGVAIRHRGVAALLAWADDAFDDRELAAVAATTSISFDLSVFELLVPLARGGAVVLADDALALEGLPARDEITLVNSVPSAVGELVRRAALPPAVATVNLAGEPLRQALVDGIFEGSAARRVLDLYGPSEDTTYSTLSACPAGAPGEPTIGRPLVGTRAYLADRRGHLVPRGVPGELLLGGAGLARGYQGRTVATAERFVPDPWSGTTGDRLYRTGDAARWTTTGELELLGRLDHQVKVRGFRIELGEVEVALEGHPSVAEAAVVAVGAGADRALAAFVARGEGEATAEALRSHLARRLPGYMVPPVIRVVPELPRTPNGKIDRRALAAEADEGTERSVPFVAPETPVEEMIAEIWREVLGVERIGIHDSFFELGGHSLKANRVLLAVEELFGVEVPVQRLFETPTIAGLAESIAEVLLGEADEEDVADILSA